MRILVAGDFCPLNRVAKKLEMNDFSSVLGVVKSIIERADYSIVNFECPVTKGGEMPIGKCGPNLQCSEKGIEAVKWAGFDCITLANNHFLDYGEEGALHTLEACYKYGVDFVGGGKNLPEASRILYKEIGDTTLAIVNCCEHEFSIATGISAGSNPLNPIQQYYSIKEAKMKADYVLVIVHGGNEYYQLPSPRMKETYRFFVDVGADAVVNHHQHCYSGFEFYQGKPIVYGLGNFCFDAKDNSTKMWTEGYMAEIAFGEEIELRTIPFIQCGEKASVCIMSDDESKSFLDVLSNLNHTIEDVEALTDEYGKFLKQSHAIIELMFSPYSGRIGRALCRHGLLPSFINAEKKKEMIGFLQCESHLPKILDFLNQKTNDA